MSPSHGVFIGIGNLEQYWKILPCLKRELQFLIQLPSVHSPLKLALISCTYKMCARNTGETSHVIFCVQGSYCLGYRPSSLWTLLSTALTHFLEDTLFKDRFALAQFCKPPNN